MRRSHVLLIVLLIVVAGCRSELNPAYCAAHPTDTRCSQIDAAGDADLDADENVTPAICLGTQPYQVCLRDLPTTDTPITQNLATGSNNGTCLKTVQEPIGWAAEGQPDACFVVGQNVTVAGTLIVKGARPLVIVATDTVTITGTLDLSAKRGNFNTGSPPPGFSAAGCTPFTTTATNSANGGGGGAGGSLGSKGGDGGAGDNGTTGAGVAIDSTPPSVLHAGCMGGAGGTGDGQGTATMITAGGWGGGAIYVLAQNKIVLSAGTVINASGAAGDAGSHRTGGGGGGSGGMIVFIAPAFDIGTSTFVYANGGGGASGGTNQSDGKNGTDPGSNPSQPAAGGTLAAAGAGGAGYALAIDAVAGGLGPSGNGGGGGGGGAGLIIASQALTPNAVVSPPSQQP
jgi:hypothetical protein